MTERAVEVTARSGGERCPFCREPVGAAEPTWTCPRCAARQHEACVREGGGRCAGCRAAREVAGAAVGAGDGRFARALSVQAGMLLVAAFTGATIGGLPALGVVVTTLTVPILVRLSEGRGLLPLLLADAAVVVLTLVGIEALDVPAKRGSMAMAGMVLLWAAVSFLAAQWFRPPPVS